MELDISEFVAEEVIVLGGNQVLTLSKLSENRVTLSFNHLRSAAWRSGREGRFYDGHDR